MAQIDIARAAEALLEARNTRRWLHSLPDGARPTTEVEAYEIQDLVARQLGPGLEAMGPPPITLVPFISQIAA